MFENSPCQNRKLTIGLYWLDPENYISLDKQTVPYYKSKYGVDFSAKTWRDYSNSISQVREKNK